MLLPGAASNDPFIFCSTPTLSSTRNYRRPNLRCHLSPFRSHKRGRYDFSVLAMNYFVWSLSLLAACSQREDVELTCPLQFPDEMVSSTTDCSNNDIDCCVAEFGMSSSYDGYISSTSAKCLAESWGLPAGEPAFFARVDEVQNRWQVHRIARYDCSPNGLGGAPGCVVFVDAYSGEFLSEADTFRTISCD